MVFENRKYNSISIYLTAGDAITVYFGNGTDTATERYLNVDYDIMKYWLRGSAAFLITHIEGKILKWPLKVHADKQFNNKKMFSDIRSMKIYGLATSKVEVFGGE